MWNHDYDGAIDYSQRLYDLNVYTLEGTDFLKVCADPQTTDNIWTLKWSYVLDGANNIVTTYVNSGNLLLLADLSVLLKLKISVIVIFILLLFLPQ